MASAAATAATTQAWRADIARLGDAGRACSGATTISIWRLQQDVSTSPRYLLAIGPLQLVEWFAPDPHSSTPPQEVAIDDGERCRARIAAIAWRPVPSALPFELDAIERSLALRRSVAEVADLYHRGRMQEADRLALHALGVDVPRTGWPLRLELIETRMDLGRFDGALDAIERTVVTLQRETPDASSMLLYAQHLRARALGQAGRLREAIAARTALVSAYAGAGSVAARDRLANAIGLGGHLLDDERPADALAVLEPAVDEARRLLSARDAVLRRGEINLAFARATTGRDEEALEALRDAYHRATDAAGAEHPNVPPLLDALGSLLVRSGRLEQARVALERAFAGYGSEYGEDAPVSALVAANLASVYGSLRRSDEAIRWLERALGPLRTAWGPDHLRVLDLERKLAWWYFDGGDAKRAAPLIAHADEGFRKRYGDDAQIAISLAIDRAYVRHALGAQGCEAFEDAARRAVSILHRGDIERGNALVALGRCQLADGTALQARESFRHARIEREMAVGPDAAPTLAALAAEAQATIAAGATREALPLLRRLVQTSERERAAETPAPEGGRGVFAERVAGRDFLAGYRDFALLLAESGEHAEALRVTELARARALADAVEARDAAHAGDVDPAARLRLDAATRRLREIDAQLALSSSASLARVRLSLQREEASRELQRLVARADTATAASAQSGRVRSNRATATARPPAGTVVLSYQSARGRNWVHAVTHEESVVRFLDRDVALASELNAWQQLISAPPTSLAPLWTTAGDTVVLSLSAPGERAQRITERALAERLGRTLLHPVARALANARRVVVIADGAVSTVPFDLLVYRGRRLVERLEVSYAPSLGSWSRDARGARQDADFAWDLVAIGAPEYPPAEFADAPPALASLRWPPLPGALQELEAIATAFESRRRVIAAGPQASRERFLELASDGTLRRTRYLHIAAHAYLAKQPQWSSLVLGGDRGYITAPELAQLDIESELVVLSACETGRGHDVPGEGLFGLPYALTVAGARATLLTLWPVADDSTAEFMKRFYRRLARGQRPGAALAETKRDFLTHPRWSAPFYWAPFVLYGGA